MDGFLKYRFSGLMNKNDLDDFLSGFEFIDVIEGLLFWVKIKYIDREMRYSVLLPVYNEIDNLPLIVYLLYETSLSQYVFPEF